MKLNLGKAVGKFSAVRDVRDVVDPWGLGWVVGIVRDGAAALVELRRRFNDEDPIAEAIFASASLAAMVGEATGDKEAGRAVAVAHLEEAAAKHGGGVLERQEARAFALAVARVAYWRGLVDVDGNDVPATPENIAEVLRSTEWVSADAPYGGQPLGQAFRVWLADESKRGEEYRAEIIQGAAGN